ncbi:hypothetical protein HG15A2_39100 [Adhaeretor mobilis]|uniref:Uncharacterized protein n=1 Tax=Adhaeretor mobilis TaxID=1930276 RepID=A0A517N0A2_9BACT|nr:hypothetical protein HG15A2_39100 [Adhaeretor mobilis]
MWSSLSAKLQLILQVYFSPSYRIPIQGPYDLRSSFYLLSISTGGPSLRRGAPSQLRYTFHTPAGLGGNNAATASFASGFSSGEGSPSCGTISTDS